MLSNYHCFQISESEGFCRIWIGSFLIVIIRERMGLADSYLNNGLNKDELVKSEKASTV
jgi:hypothetical protein